MRRNRSSKTIRSRETEDFINKRKFPDATFLVLNPYVNKCDRNSTVNVVSVSENGIIRAYVEERILFVLS